MWKMLFVGLLAVGLPVANAGTCTGGACYDVLINTLYVNATGDVYITTDGVVTWLNCAPLSGVFLTLQRAAGNFSQVFGLLTAAQFAGHKLNIRINDGSNGCTIAYITSSR